VLRGLAAEQGTPRLDAPLGDALDQRRDPLGHDRADRDVVLQEQRLGPAHDQVVDDHGDQVDADRVVHVHRLRHRDLGADPVRGRREHRVLPAVQPELEQPGKAADAT
jgi:hypothetical protein